MKDVTSFYQSALLRFVNEAVRRWEPTAEFVFHAVSQSLSLSLSFHSVFLSKTRFPGKKGAGFSSVENLI